MTSSARQPRGIPVGGQFAPSARTEPGIALPGTPVILPDSSVGYGKIVAERIESEDRGSTVRALTTTSEFDGQLRAYLGVEDPDAPVTMRIESVYYDYEEGQVYTASCGGRETHFEVLSSFLDHMGTAVAAGSPAQGSPVNAFGIFTEAGERAAAGSVIREIQPETKDEAERLLSNRGGLPNGEVLQLELNHETVPDSGPDGYVELASPSDGRPLILHTGSTNRRFRVTSGTVSIRADSAAGNHLAVGPGARATIVASPDAHVSVRVEDGGRALFRCASESDRIRAFTEGTGRIDVQYGAADRRPYSRRS